MSDGAEYLKYVTERLVQYWEEPESREQRRERKRKREPWAVRWFGQLLPVGFSIWLSERKQTAQNRQQDANLNTEPLPDYS